MSADQVPAEFVAELQGPFQIEPGTGAPRASRGHAQRFRGHVDREEAAIVLPAAFDHREARTGTGDRSTDVDRLGIVATGDTQAPQAFGLFIDLKNLT